MKANHNLNAIVLRTFLLEIKPEHCRWPWFLSLQIGDYKMPFKISNHPVCTYTGRIPRTVILSQCQGYPDPTIQVFDAAGCACQQCDSDFTSCENLNGWFPHRYIVIWTELHLLDEIPTLEYLQAMKCQYTEHTQHIHLYYLPMKHNH